MSKKIILLIVVVIGLSLGVYYVFIRNKKEVIKSVEVVRGDILQEVSEIGQVKAQEELNLGFKNSGRVSEIYVKVGDIVEKNQVLAKLDTSQLIIQLQEAEAALEMAKSQYDKLLAGATKEEIQLAETKVANAQISLNDAQRKLETTEIKADTDLKSVYDSGLFAVQKSVSVAKNTILVLTDIQYSHFTDSSEYSTRIADAKKEAIYSLFGIEAAGWWTTESISKLEGGIYGRVKTAAANPVYEELDSILSDAFKALQKTKTALEIVPIVETLTSTERTNLSTEKSNINTEIITLSGKITAIETQKSTNQTNILLAEEELNKTKNSLLIAQDELALKKARPSQEDISLYQAQIKQAQAKMFLLQNQIQESVLKSPLDGKVTKINKKAGETIQSTEFIVSLISKEPFQVKADIYEENIVKIKIGAPVKITLPAFPKRIFKGSVIFIDETEKIIDGVVYYEIKIAFDEDLPEGIRPTMTADVVIQSEMKENVLVLPRETIQRKAEKTIVEVLADGLIEEREIEIGLRGDDLIEIVSGLEEGEKVILK